MKKSGIIAAFLVIFIMVVPSQMSAQEENGFKKFNVIDDFSDNPAGVHSMYIGEVVNAWKK